MRKLLLLLLSGSLIGLVVAPALADQEEGLKIYKQYGCHECHAISALKIGVEKVALEEGAVEEEDLWGEEEGEDVAADDLSNVGLARDAKWISSWLRKKVDNDGVLHKKRFQGSKEERQALALWLETLKYELPEGVGVDVPTPQGTPEPTVEGEKETP
ncbi:MAG: hypothetical protein ACI9UQ_001053 [Candidatus Krumholzibacteriia bacterium]|jgi:hypothetical protein